MSLRRLSIVMSVLLVLSSSALARGQGSRIVFTLTDHGITSIMQGGHELLSGRGYYIVEACAGNDTDPGERLYSLPVEQEDPACTCPCSPYVITLTKVRKDRVHARVTIGPLGADCSLVAVRLDAVAPGLISRQLGVRTPGSTYSATAASSEVRFGPGVAGDTFLLEEDIVVN